MFVLFNPATRFSVLLGSMLSLLAVTHVQHASAQAVVNWSFEVPVTANNGTWETNPTEPGIGWTFSGVPGNGSGVQKDGSIWGADKAPFGGQTAFIQKRGTISQTFYFKNGSYKVYFDAARRATDQPAGSVQPIKVSIDGQQIGSLVSPASTVFSSFTIPFPITTSGLHTLSFAGTEDAGDWTTFIDSVTLGPEASRITSGPSDIYPGSVFTLVGSDFGAPAGKITIYFPDCFKKSPNGPPCNDVPVKLGTPVAQWWYPGLVGGTVPKDLVGVVAQTVYISITTKNGGKSNDWPAQFHPRKEVKVLPMQYVTVPACSDGGVANDCNHLDPYGEMAASIDCFGAFNTYGTGFPGDSFGAYHHGCLGFTGDRGMDQYSASLKNGWTFDSLKFLTVMDNGTAWPPGVFPPFEMDPTDIQIFVAWRIGAIGGSASYGGDLTIVGPKGVPFHD
jgi:hypothetical protein